ncbi:MAG: glycosyltransferase family 2 protein [Bacteroidota bacterium]
MNNLQYTFTIFTPCYNSEKFIHRVFESLNRQTYRNFEWIVINDASTDNTAQLIKRYIKTVDFDVQFFDLSKNQMLSKNFNLAVKSAKGCFFLPTGHDDEFVEDTLEKLLAYWTEYGSDKFSGISCLCKNQTGNIVGDFFPCSPYFSNYFEIIYDKKIKGEKWGMTRTDVMKEFLLPEDIDDYISEALIWAGIGSKYKTIYLNEPLRIYYMNEQGFITLSSLNKYKFKYIKGIRYQNLIMINKYISFINGNYKRKLIFFINYIRMSLHSNINLFKIINDIEGKLNKLLTILLLFVGYAVSKKDKLQKRI